MGKKDKKSSRLAAERRERIAAARSPGPSAPVTEEVRPTVRAHEKVATPVPTPAPADDSPLGGKLRSTWRRERGFRHLGGVCRLVVWVIGLFLADLLIDWLFDLPGGLRLALAAVNVAVLVWVGWGGWVSRLRRYDPLETALKVEGLYPGLRSGLVSYVQLDDRSGDPAQGSPAMIRAMRERTADEARTLDFGAVVDFSRLRPLIIATAAAVVVFAAGSALAGPFYSVLLSRLFNPNSTAAYPTRTQITDITGDVSVRLGDPVDLKAVAGGEIPAEGVVRVRFGEAPWEKLSLPAAEGGPAAGFLRRFPEVRQDFTYQVRLGDASSREYKVSSVPAPKIVAGRLRITDPAYTAVAPRETDALSADAVEGAKLEWELTLDRGLKSAEVLREGIPAEAMSIDPADARVVRWSAPAGKSFSYQFRWTDKDHGFGYADGIKYQIRVMPDAMPTVEILPPIPDERATINKTVDLKFRARDDFGLGEAWIVWSLNGGPEMRRAAGILTGRDATAGAKWKLRDSMANLKEGDLLTMAVEVADNREGPAGANRSRSKPVRLQFISTEDYLRYIQETRGELFTRLTGVHQEESESSDTLKTLKREPQP